MTEFMTEFMTKFNWMTSNYVRNKIMENLHWNLNIIASAQPKIIKSSN